MAMSKREETIWKEIQAFEESILQYETNDFVNVYNNWTDQALSLVPEPAAELFFNKLDTWLFHLNSLIQGTQIQNDAREQILVTGRIFNESIQSIQDLRQLNADQLKYIAEQHASRHRLYSFLQGGITGTGQALILSTDFLAMLVLNLRAVQLTAMSYGYDVQIPFEMMTSLKVFHAATLPARLKGEGWNELMKDLEVNHHDSYFYGGNEQLTNVHWLEEPLKQLVKVFFIASFSRKTLSRIPLLSMGIGAVSNYRYTRKVTEFASRYYQYRYLLDKYSAQ
ncbi:EcsC family protein [Heyndrickxia acidicola]|uniref:EcsC family protein n=1 Tax=Heyndrickxia acidicola TaxID=209389 RepID=A0ABU6MFF5_9BACI|nr:EcsC family protein [Heyndrickxia acidicola]MED1203195.1 EcsC family protein [Heyndrickxia acidicola]